MIIKDLGAVSAYAYAVEKGYTGTEEEFATLMASYATVAEEAAESAESASASATSASTSATTATTKASEATTAAQTATAKAEEAQADADAAALDASQALSAASTATTKASEAAQSASDAVTAKTAAQTAQTAAEGSATTAQTAAQTATQKAAEAAESARTLTIDTTLTQSGQAADSKVVGDKIGEVKSAIVENGIYRKTVVNVVVSNNSYKWAAYNNSKFVIYSVNPSDEVTIKAASITAYYTVLKTDDVVVGDYPIYATGYTKLETVTASKTATVTIPSDGYYILIVYYQGTTNVTPSSVKVGSFELLDNIPDNINTLATVVDELDENINDLDGTVNELNERIDAVEDDVSDLEDVLIITESTTETVTETFVPTWSAGYIAADGTPYLGDNGYHYSNKISVNPGDIIKLYRASDSAAIHSSRFLTAYKNNIADPSKGGAYVALPWVVPDNVDEVIFSVQIEYGNATGDNTHTVTTETKEPSLTPDVNTLFDLVSSKKANRYLYKFDLAANVTYETNEQFEDISSYKICFFAKFSTLTDKVIIGKAIGQDYGGAIAFDGTYIYEYSGTGANPVRDHAHGLTLKDYVGIVFDMSYGATAKVTIFTNDINAEAAEHPTGSKDTWEIPFWRSRYGTITVRASDALTDCRLSYTCEGLFKDTWLFGDSYLSNTGNDRWTSYLVSGGYTNYLLNSYPGRNSAQALASLKVDLALNRYPKRLLWLLGMNDKDQEDAPNASWLSALNEVIGICNDKHIELILSTIPNTPSANTKNTEKNAYVLELCGGYGYRCIDFANAISADGSGTWYDGMLEENANVDKRIHPTVRGAVALYNCAVTEVPELLT